MLAIPAIFGFIAILFLISIPAIDFVFNFKSKSKSNFAKVIFPALSLSLWFFLGAFSTLFFSYNVVKLTQFLSGNNVQNVQNVSLEQPDCEILLEKIYQAENQIYQVENHRYIEETFTSSNIKIKYQEGAEILNSIAEEYLNLNISPNQNYSKQLAQALTDKAQLFQKRLELSRANSKDLQKFRNIIGDMDRATQKRKNLIGTIEKRCNNL
jgi:hypothetical protein